MFSKSKEISVQSQLKKSNTEFAQVCKEYAVLQHEVAELEKRMMKLQTKLESDVRDRRTAERDLRREKNPDEIAKLQKVFADAVAAKQKTEEDITKTMQSLADKKQAAKGQKEKKRTMQAKLELEMKQKKEDVQAAPVADVKSPVSMMFTSAPAAMPAVVQPAAEQSVMPKM